MGTSLKATARRRYSRPSQPVFAGPARIGSQCFITSYSDVARVFSRLEAMGLSEMGNSVALVGADGSID
jgi:hypothetical protein